MSKFEIKNFFQFDDGSANFNLTTTAGMYYDCKLVAYQGGHFLASAQSRGFDKKEGGKGYVKAFGALQGTKAAEFFDEVAVEAARLLKRNSEPSGNSGQLEEPPFNPDDDIPF